MTSEVNTEAATTDRLELLSEKIGLLVDDWILNLYELSEQISSWGGGLYSSEKRDVFEVLADFTDSTVEDIRQVVIDAYAYSLRNYLIDPSPTWDKFKGMTGKVGFSSYTAFSVLRAVQYLYRATMQKEFAPMDDHGGLKVLLDEDHKPVIVDGEPVILDPVKLRSGIDHDVFLKYMDLLPKAPKGRKDEFAIIAYAAMENIKLYQMAVAQDVHHVIEF